MATVTLEGKIKLINPVETVGANGTFRKRSFLLEEQKDQHASTWMLETHQDKCLILDNFQVGQTVKCQVEVIGKRWEAKAFNTLKAWKIEAVGTAEGGQTHNEAVEPVDDLPF